MRKKRKGKQSESGKMKSMDSFEICLVNMSPKFRRRSCLVYVKEITRVSLHNDATSKYGSSLEWIILASSR